MSPRLRPEIFSDAGPSPECGRGIFRASAELVLARTGVSFLPLIGETKPESRLAVIRRVFPAASTQVQPGSAVSIGPVFLALAAQS